ncbi:MAG: hypothetical protein AAGD18_06205 [Actinomycetota bacterium]
MTTPGAVLERDVPTARPMEAGRRGRMVGAWPIAARLARREVRRRPGRTALVTLLVLVPVAAMTLGSVLLRSDLTAWSGGSGLFVGGDRILVTGTGDEFADEPADVTPPPTADELAVAVGDRGTVFSITAVYSEVVARNGEPRFVQLTEVPDGAHGAVDGAALAIDRGRLPTSADEVLVSRPLAAAFGVDVGDRLVLDEPDREWMVVGVGRNRTDHRDPVLVVGELDRDDIRPSQLNVTLNVVPAPGQTEVARRELLHDIEAIGAAYWLADARDDEQGRALFWGWVGGVVALLATGVVVSAAFATSARRQLVTVGQLAANGAPQHVISRSLSLQGSWTGLVGGCVGVAIALVAVLVGWSQLEDLIGRDLVERRIVAADLVIIVATAVVAATVAARFPARSAARVPVLTALGGRRPVAALPVWIGPLGLASVAFGVLCLAVVASAADAGDLAALLAFLGATAIIVGVVCIAPVLVELVGRVGRWTQGSLLLAVRGIVRQRSRSAAMVAAGAVVIGLATAVLTVMESTRADSTAAGLHGRTVVAELHPDATGTLTGPTFPATIGEDVLAVLPDARQVDVERVRLPIDLAGDPWRSTAIVVADDVTAELIDLDDEQRARLEELGVAVVGPWPDVSGIDGRVVPGTAAVLHPAVVVTPAWAAERDLDRVIGTVVFVTDARFSDEEDAELRRLARDLDPWDDGSAFISVFDDSLRLALGEPVSAWTLYPTWRGDSTPWALVQTAVLAIVLLLVLGVVGSGLALSAVEGRDERDVLDVVGAPPAVLRRLAASQTAVLTLTAATVAVPMGYLVVWAVRAASASEAATSTTPVPWVGVLALLAVVPAVAAVSTWAASGISGRLRPINASRLRRP